MELPIMMNKILNEDCRLTMAAIPDKFIDLVITSPPYNMNLRIRKGKYCSRQIVKEFSTKYIAFDDNLPIDDFYNLHSEILKELMRISKIVFYNIQLVTGSKRAFFKMIGEFGDDLKEIVIWDKVNAQPAMRDNVLNSRYEFILIFGDNSIARRFTNGQFDRGTLDNLWPIKRNKTKSKNHGATFPEELANKIINNFSSPSNIIYDPFAGTGTTLLAAKKLGRNYIGSEINKEYCEYINSIMLDCERN
jgi:site-specific DNA-methyltransferase (adenine-specific)